MPVKSDNPVLVAAAACARAGRLGTAEDLKAARENLAETRLQMAVQRAIDAAPPLTTEARERLAQLLLSGGEK